jgi:hypothetical protein
MILERRVQAELIAAWHESPGVVLLNKSGQPVYGVVVNVLTAANSEPQPLLPFLVLPPGTWLVPDTAGLLMGAMAFTDCTGRAHWLRLPNGTVSEIDRGAVAHFDLSPGEDQSYRTALQRY